MFNAIFCGYYFENCKVVWENTEWCLLWTYLDMDFQNDTLLGLFKLSRENPKLFGQTQKYLFCLSIPEILTESCMFGFVWALCKLPTWSGTRPLALLWSSVVTSRFCQSAVLQVLWEKMYLCFVCLKYPCGGKCQREVGQF